MRGGLVSIKGLSKIVIERLCKDAQCYIAIENSPIHYLVGGEEAALARFLESAALTPLFEKARRLRVSVPSHTPLLLSAVKPFTALLQECNIQDPSLPVLAGIDANSIARKGGILKTLPAQIAQTICFEKVLRTAVEQGVSVFLEIGPGQALASMVRALSLPVEVKSLDDFASITGAEEWTAMRLQN